MKELPQRYNNYLSKLSPEWFFVFLATIFGTIFILITPPFQTPDEPVHFYRIYQISEGNMSVDNFGSLSGGFLPKSLGNVLYATDTRPTIEFRPDKKYHTGHTISAFKIQNNTEDRMFYDFSATALYPPVAYLPQSIGAFLARIAHLPAIVVLYSAKFTNLVAWVLLFVIAIRLTPKKKWAFAAVGLLPMALFQAGSLSTDVMATGIAALFLAYVLRLSASKGELKSKQLMILLFTGIFMVLTKQIMFVLLPLVLLLPNNKFRSNRRAAILKTLLGIVPIISYISWLLAVKGVNVSASFANGQNPPEQVKFVITHPHSFINALWNTNFFSWGDSVTTSLIGTFGWMDAPLGQPIVITGYIALFLIIVGSYGSRKTWLSARQKIILSIVALAFWLCVEAALYAYYSPVGYKIVVGLQGRYFIPLILLIIPLSYGYWLRMSESTYKKIATLSPIILLVAGIITVYFRYYINNV